MRRHASLLVDIHFETRDRGWVVGGLDAVGCPGQRATRDVVRPVVLFTEDGGATWTDLIPGIDEREFPLGEWGWKMFFLNEPIAFVSLENFRDGAILKSVDGGRTWKRLRINDRQRNSNLEGVGFISETVGWVGGWGTSISAAASPARPPTAARIGITQMWWASGSTASAFSAIP